MARGLRVRRRLLVAAVVVVAVAAVAGVWLTRRSASVPQASATTVKVATTTLNQAVTATGTIAPKVRSDLSFTSPGTVTDVAVKVGDQVSAGQTLASIDPTALQQAVDSAQASVDAADATLSATQSSSTATSNQITAATSQVKAATAKLQTAKTARAAADLQSPVSGTVAAVNIAVGNQVSGSVTGSGSSSGSAASGSGSISGSGSAGGQVAPGSGSAGGQAASGAGSASGTGGSASSGGGASGQIDVISTDSWVVATSVSAADLPLVKPDLQAQIVPTGSTTTVFGTVSSVGVIATTSSGVASFPVTVAVTGNPTGLYAGGTASVSITVKEVTDALVVPTAAVTTVDGKTVVTQVKDGQPVSTPVTLGMVQGNLTQVTAGLSDGDQVLVTRPAGTPPQGGSTATRTRGTGGFGGSGPTGAPPNVGGQGGASLGGAPAGGGQGGAPAAGSQGGPPAGGGQ